MCKPEALFTLPIDDIISGWNPACSYWRTALNLIFRTLPAQFKFNNNVER